MRIGALSALTGLSRDTIRFYEKHGLIYSDQSTEATNTYRNYSEDTAERLRMIADARHAGISVPDLVQLLTTMESDEPIDFDLEKFCDTRIAQLEQVIETAQRTLAVFKATRQAATVTDFDYEICAPTKPTIPSDT